jgi:hypothetical protein
MRRDNKPKRGEEPVSDPLAFLRAAHAEAEAEAEAAAERAWTPHWDYDDLVNEIRDLNNGNTLANVYFPEIGKHVEANDPAAVLRRIAADRKLLDDLIAERHLVVDDCWYTCRAATDEHDGGENCNDAERGKPCDCGRDTRVNRRIRLLAEGWGWTGETT